MDSAGWEGGREEEEAIRGALLRITPTHSSGLSWYSTNHASRLSERLAQKSMPTNLLWQFFTPFIGGCGLICMQAPPSVSFIHPTFMKGCISTQLTQNFLSVIVRHSSTTANLIPEISKITYLDHNRP